MTRVASRSAKRLTSLELHARNQTDDDGNGQAGTGVLRPVIVIVASARKLEQLAM